MTKLEAKGNSKEYKLEAIWNNPTYANKAESHQQGLYYLVAWKRYSKEKNTWKQLFAIQYLKKLINSFYKKHLEKPTATSPSINSAPPMARPIVKPTRPTITKRNRDQPVNNASKQAKN